MLAGFLAGGGKGADALVEGLAWGAAAVLQPGSGMPSPADDLFRCERGAHGRIGPSFALTLPDASTWEACVAAYALKFDEDRAKWGITALLHDFDWEVHPQTPDHPMKGEPILAERGVPEEIRRAILSHANYSGVPRTALQSAKHWSYFPYT